MSKENYYKSLGIPVTASPDEIKAAYRKLARKYHPDLNPNDKNANKKFQAINEANQVLSDPKKREAYDQYVADWKNAPEKEPPLRKKAKKESKPQGETYKAYYDLDYGNIKIKIRMTDAYLFTSFTIDF